MRLDVITEMRLSVIVQVANQHMIEKTSTKLVRRMLKQVEEKWLQIGILKYKFLKNNEVKQISVSESLSDLVS